MMRESGKEISERWGSGQAKRKGERKLSPEMSATGYAVPEVQPSIGF